MAGVEEAGAAVRQKEEVDQSRCATWWATASAPPMYAGMLRSTLGAAWRRGSDPARVARELLAGIDFLEGATCGTLGCWP
ncbi:MAG TPA: hypothetical protein VFE33_04430 [Thermoanaerobaculia bacterium]|nr:hypothetical protein [Thermoanaerobaculia bacterium]